MTLAAKSGTAIFPCLAEVSPLCAIPCPRDRTFYTHLPMPCYSTVIKGKIAGGRLSPPSLLLSLPQHLLGSCCRIWLHRVYCGMNFAGTGASSTSFNSKPEQRHLHSSETSDQTDRWQAVHQPSSLEISIVISIADPANQNSMLAGSSARLLNLVCSPRVWQPLRYLLRIILLAIVVFMNLPI